MDTKDTAPVRFEDLLSEKAWMSALARSLVYDEATALDLAQDTYLTALERPPSTRTSIRGWLATVLRNRFRDRIRVENRRGRRERAVARPEETPSAAELAARADAHRKVLEAVVGLDEPYREVVLLRYYESLSPKEVAARQGVPASTVRTRLARARERLRRSLDGEHGGSRRAWALALLPLAARRPASGPGAFLMLHKVEFAALAVLPIVLLAIGISVGAGEDPAPPARTSAEVAPVDPVREPSITLVADEPPPEEAPESVPETPRVRTGRTDLVPLPLADSVWIAIEYDGTVEVGRERVRLAKGTAAGDPRDRLVQALLGFAKKKRETAHPMQPSAMAPLLDADGDAPWWIVRDVMTATAHPMVRMYRLHLLAVPDGKDEEMGLPVFLPKDRGLSNTRVRLLRAPEIRIALLTEPGANAVRVRLLDRDLGVDDAGLAALADRLPALCEENPGRALIISASDEVPLDRVVRALDLVPDPDGLNLDLADSPLRGFLRSDVDAEALLGETLARRKLEFDGSLVDEVEGLAPEFRAFLAESLPAHERAALLEDVVVADYEKVAEVRRLLSSPTPSLETLEKLAELVRRDRGLLMALSGAWLEVGRAEDCVRALTLAGIVSGAEPDKRYSRSWWRSELLVLGAYVRYGEVKQDRKTLADALARFAAFEALGILERSPDREEILALRERAEKLKEWLK